MRNCQTIVRRKSCTSISRGLVKGRCCCCCCCCCMWEKRELGIRAWPTGQSETRLGERGEGPGEKNTTEGRTKSCCYVFGVCLCARVCTLVRGDAFCSWSIGQTWDRFEYASLFSSVSVPFHLLLPLLLALQLLGVCLVPALLMPWTCR